MLDFIDFCITFVIYMLGLSIAYFFHNNFQSVFLIGMVTTIAIMFAIGNKHLYDEENKIAE